MTNQLLTPNITAVTLSTPLQRELRQKRPFLSASQEGAVAILRTSDVIRRAIASVVEPAGITTQQYNVLRILRGAAEGGLPTLEIAERMVEQTPGITRLLDRLELKGLVQRKRCDRDRRQVLCWITPGGLDLLGTLDSPVLHASETALAALSPAEQSTLIDLLDRIRATADARNTDGLPAVAAD